MLWPKNRLADTLTPVPSGNVEVSSIGNVTVNGDYTKMMDTDCASGIRKCIAKIYIRLPGAEFDVERNCIKMLAVGHTFDACRFFMHKLQLSLNQSSKSLFSR